MLTDLGVKIAGTGDRPFPDSDRAIEWAEDQVVDAPSAGDAVPDTLAFEDFEVVRGLSATELARLRPHARSPSVHDR